MPRGMFADDVENRCPRPARVVQIGTAVGKSRTEVEQSHGWFLCHSTIAIGCSRAHTLKKAKDRTNATYGIKCRHKRQLGCSRVGKTYFDSGVSSRCLLYTSDVDDEKKGVD